MISMEDKKKRTAPGFEVKVLGLQQQHIVRTSSLIYRLSWTASTCGGHDIEYRGGIGCRGGLWGACGVQSSRLGEYCLKLWGSRVLQVQYSYSLQPYPGSRLFPEAHDHDTFFCGLRLHNVDVSMRIRKEKE
jgi:hypothetical protein